jgi:hypothetical protein
MPFYCQQSPASKTYYNIFILFTDGHVGYGSLQILRTPYAMLQVNTLPFQYIRKSFKGKKNGITLRSKLLIWKYTCSAMCFPVYYYQNPKVKEFSIL